MIKKKRNVSLYIIIIVVIVVEQARGFQGDVCVSWIIYAEDPHLHSKSTNQTNTAATSPSYASHKILTLYITHTQTHSTTKKLIHTRKITWIYTQKHIIAHTHIIHASHKMLHTILYYTYIIHTQTHNICICTLTNNKYAWIYTLISFLRIINHMY